MAHYVFVASAGAYKGNKIEPALVEGDVRKDSAGHVEVEKYLEQQVPGNLAHTNQLACCFCRLVRAAGNTQRKCLGLTKGH